MECAMDLRQLRTFRMVAATGNFTQAAMALNYAQSSVTAQIQALEADLGAPLFDRRPRRVLLTEAGKRLLGSSDRLLALADQARASVAGLASPVETLTLSAPDTLCTYRLPAVFREFRKRCPQVRLIFRPTAFTNHRAWVSEGLLDLAFVLEEPIKGGVLQVEALAREPLALVAPPEHPLALKAKVVTEDLAGQALLFNELGCSYRNRFEHALIAAGVYPATTLASAASSPSKPASPLASASRCSPASPSRRSSPKGASWPSRGRPRIRKS
jgi:DNA-binding transcriptional LysR family regulator